MRLGILGGGQLGRMLALAAHPLGISVTVVDPNPETPAKVAAKHIVRDYSDPVALDELAATSDVVTFEFENVPDEAVRQLAGHCPVYPNAEVLRVAQDRFFEKSAFRTLGIETADFLAVDSEDDLLKAFEKLGPLVLKTRRFGYDGKGQKVIRTPSDLAGAHAELGSVPCIAESFVPFERELSVIICRGKDGSSVVYPLSQNTHEQGILRLTIAPAPNVSETLENAAKEWAKRLADHFDYVGVLALELFDLGGRLVANECAPRVHNSGHYSIEGCLTSQFENHVRAVSGLPLGATDAFGPAAMLNCVGAMPDAAAVLRVPDAHLHDYGKPKRPSRKVGHITVRAKSYEDLEKRVRELRALLVD